jgi:hypothetical protein
MQALWKKRTKKRRLVEQPPLTPRHAHRVLAPQGLRPGSSLNQTRWSFNPVIVSNELWADVSHLKKAPLAVSSATNEKAIRDMVDRVVLREVPVHVICRQSEVGDYHWVADSLDAYFLEAGLQCLGQVLHGTRFDTSVALPNVPVKMALRQVWGTTCQQWGVGCNGAITFISPIALEAIESDGCLREGMYLGFTPFDACHE